MLVRFDEDCYFCFFLLYLANFFLAVRLLFGILSNCLFSFFVVTTVIQSHILYVTIPYYNICESRVRMKKHFGYLPLVEIFHAGRPLYLEVIICYTCNHRKLL